MTTLKHLHKRLDQMTNATYIILRNALLLTCTMAICALALFYASGGPTITGFAAYMTAHELISLGALILFVAVIASAVVEEMKTKK